MSFIPVSFTALTMTELTWALLWYILETAFFEFTNSFAEKKFQDQLRILMKMAIGEINETNLIFCMLLYLPFSRFVLAFELFSVADVQYP